MRKIRILVLVVMIAAILLLSGCDVWDMIMDDMLRDILSKLNPFTHLFGGNGTTAVPPTSTQVVGTAVLTSAIITILALSNGAFQNLVNLFSGLRHDSAATILPSEGTKTTEPANANELWEIIKNGGPELEKLKNIIQQQRLENIVKGTALPEMIDVVGAPPTIQDVNEKLHEVADGLRGTETPDNWIDIREILETGTTVKAVVVGIMASILNISWPWAVAIGVATGLTDKYIPDTYSIVEPFYQAEKPDSGLPEADSIVWTPVPPEKYPQLKKEDLWKLPRDERLKMWQDSRDWIQKLGGSDPPTTVEEWERRYEKANSFVNQYEQDAKEDPNITDTDDYKKWRYQRDLLDTLRASGPRMELQ
jgi:hypothetical protein